MGPESQRFWPYPPSNGLMQETIEAVRRDLVTWGVLEPDDPVRFTRRFRGALARAAASLQGRKEAGETGLRAVEGQVDLALDDLVEADDAGLSDRHRRFVVALQVTSLPPSVRSVLGL